LNFIDEHFVARLLGTGLRVALGDAFLLGNAWDENGDEQAFEVELTGDGGYIEVRANRLRLSAPAPVDIELADAPLKINIDEEKRVGFNLDGAAFEIDRNRWRKELDVPLELSESLRFTLGGAGEIETNGAWRFNLVPTWPARAIGLSGPTGPIAVGLDQLQLKVEGRGTGSVARVTCDVQAGGLEAAFDGSNVQCPRFGLFGRLDSATNGAVSMNAVASLSDARYRFDAFAAEKIEARLPLRWPEDPEAEEDPGYFRIGRMNHGDYPLGRIDSTLVQRNAEIWILGEYLDLFPDVVGRFFGSASIHPTHGPTMEVGFKLAGENYDLPLKNFMPDTPKAGFSGHLAVTGSASLVKGAFTSACEVSLSHGRFTIPEFSLTLHGLETELDFEDLVEGRSPRHQFLSFAGLQLGKMKLEEGFVFYHIESWESYFLEKLHLSWCDGDIYSHSFRLTTAMNEFDIMLFCDRLNLARILEQFELAEAEGEGTLSGRVPLIYKDRRPHLDGGFLFSSPGEGGSIRIEDAAKLATGLGEGTQTQIAQAMAGVNHVLANVGHSLQMQIARESLKHYEYEWAKLTLGHKDGNPDDLLVTFELKGKPADTLPFGFSPKKGLYFAGEDSPWEAEFKALGFTFNLLIPLNELLEVERRVSGMVDEIKSDVNKN
ncbi:MAG: YdbH domain-containing protein, partial [Verrucomicrobiota bacterium]